MLRFKQFLIETDIFQPTFNDKGRSLIKGSSVEGSKRWDDFLSAFNSDNNYPTYTDTDIFTTGQSTPIKTDKIDLKIDQFFYNISTGEKDVGPRLIDLGKKYNVMVVVDEDGNRIVLASGLQQPKIMVKGVSGISWNESNLETAAIMGLFVDGKKLLNMYEKKDNDGVKKELLSALTNGGNWKNQSVNLFKKRLSATTKNDTISDGDLVQTISLATGMSQFQTNVLDDKFKYFIHSDIDDYYNVETVGEVVKSVKDNTADTVISTVSWKELETEMKNNTVSSNIVDGYCFIEETPKVKWYQVSLKKAHGQAQLGKITKFVKAVHGLSDTDSIFNSIFSEGFMNDLFSRGKDVVKTFFSKVYEKMKKVFGIIQNFVKRRQKLLARTQKKQLRAVVRELGFGPTDLISEEKILSEVKRKSIGKKIQELTDERAEKLVTTVVNELQTLQRRLSSTTWAGMQEVEGITYDKQAWKNNSDAPFKLFANVCAIRALNSILFSGDEERMLETVKTNLSEIYADMFFGKTELPLWKVYGTIDDSKAYEYLGTYSGMIDHKKDVLTKGIGAMEEENSDLRMVGVKASVQKGLYYNIESAFLWNYHENGEFEWSQNRMGTNQGGEKVTWIFEGGSFIKAHIFRKNYIPKAEQ
jgi:hypothetical protein